MSASRLAVSIGCPSGIGPEVSLVAALRALDRGIQCVLVGDLAALLRAARLRSVPTDRLRPVSDPRDCFASSNRIDVLCPTPPLSLPDMAFGSPSPAGGAAQLAWIDAATDMVVDHLADAIVTGPVSKEAISRSGAPGAGDFAGHTEHIARRVGCHDPTMIFVSRELTVALVTTHLALARVPSAISVEAVASATFRAAELVSLLGHSPARVVVAALNPHAGEGGMFGSEEQSVIAPGVAAARERARCAGIDAHVDGPVGAETAFRKAFDGHYDAAVAMYHDQGTIPMKLRCFGSAVNVTAGMPIVRTSVDHGTGYDIAGSGRADAGSMLEALELADRLVAARSARSSGARG